MKQGSADDPFADDTSGETDDAATADSDSQASEGDYKPSGTADPQSQQSVSHNVDPADGRPSLPYIHARDGVKDGRRQRPVFLRDHIEEGIDELLDQMESELDEDVYKTDVTEAAMAVAQENPKLVLAKLQEWGYGLR
jgi:hypothetical protein